MKTSLTILLSLSVLFTFLLEEVGPELAQIIVDFIEGEKVSN